MHDKVVDLHGHEKFARPVRQVGKTVAAIRSNYGALVKPVEPLHLTLNSRGPDSDATLVGVRAATANLIVSGDNNLLMLGTFRHIRIVGSINALATLLQIS